MTNIVQMGQMAAAKKAAGIPDPLSGINKDRFAEAVAEVTYGDGDGGDAELDCIWCERLMVVPLFALLLIGGGVIASTIEFGVDEYYRAHYGHLTVVCGFTLLFFCLLSVGLVLTIGIAWKGFPSRWGVDQ